MSKQILLIENHKNYKRGQVLENCLDLSIGVLDTKDELIPREKYVYLTESLSHGDEEQVRRIIREVLKKVMWRMYTRSAFIVQ